MTAASHHRVDRREFLCWGAAGAAAAGLALRDSGISQAALPNDRRCILINLVGGPSQLDTFDPKPEAPEAIRGPFRPIRTSVPGIIVSELLPRLASRMDRLAVIRSLHHSAAPIHETGLQMLQTGRLFRNGQSYPCVGSIVARHTDTPTIAFPGPIDDTGVAVSHGQTSAYLGPDCEPRFFRPALTPDERYGSTEFGAMCRSAVERVSGGTRFATINMFQTVFQSVTWDCHADGGSLPATLYDYATTLCPMFDQALSAMLDDLEARGLLASTLVVASGEFGRTPRLNPRGGRDHWAGCWSALVAGGNIRAGRVIGRSDRIGSEPVDAPCTPADLAASMYRWLGFPENAVIPGPNGEAIPLAEGRPIAGLFV